MKKLTYQQLGLLSQLSHGYTIKATLKEPWELGTFKLFNPQGKLVRTVPATTIAALMRNYKITTNDVPGFRIVTLANA